MKKVLLRIGIVLLFVGTVLFFLPHSLADLPFQPHSARIRIIDRGLDQKVIELPAESSELDAVIELLDPYSYHCSFCTISSLLEGRPSMEGNDAGFWVSIDLYSEADYQGEYFEITSGGTTEIIFGDTVWRMGYWGNTKNLQFTDAVYKLVSTYQKRGYDE